jgi:hypothetical protein
MKNRIRRGIAAALAVAAAAAIAVGSAGIGAAAAPSSLQAFGLTGDGTLMAAFKTDRPDVLDWVRRPSGLVGDTTLQGLDFRVQDGKLYALGNRGGIYTVTVTSDQRVVLAKVSQLTVTLQGSFFGFDFNPAADRLRIVSDTGQNLRHNLNDHTTVVDGILTSNGVTAVGYTNNDLNADTATTLFGVNTLTDQVVILAPPNNGTLNPTGSTVVKIEPNAGFDIFSELVNGKAVAVTAFGAFDPEGPAMNGLYTVNLLNGEATLVDVFPLDITEVAVALQS